MSSFRGPVPEGLEGWGLGCRATPNSGSGTLHLIGPKGSPRVTFLSQTCPLSPSLSRRRPHPVAPTSTSHRVSVPSPVLGSLHTGDLCPSLYFSKRASEAFLGPTGSEPKNGVTLGTVRGLDVLALPYLHTEHSESRTLPSLSRGPPRRSATSPSHVPPEADGGPVDVTTGAHE